MTTNNGRNRTLADADVETIREVINRELFGLEFTEHVGSIVLGAVEEKLEEKIKPIHAKLEGLNSELLGIRKRNIDTMDRVIGIFEANSEALQTINKRIDLLNERIDLINQAGK